MISRVCINTSSSKYMKVKATLWMASSRNSPSKPKAQKLQLCEIHHAHRFWLRWLGKSKQRRFNNFQDEDTTKSKGKCAYMGKDGRYIIRWFCRKKADFHLEFEFVPLQVASWGLQLGFQHKKEQGQSTFLLSRSLQNLMTCWLQVS